MTTELVPGEDGKMRYFRPLRTEMYTKMLSWIRRYTADTPLYLCMETQTVWQRTFGHAPACSADLEQSLQAGEKPPGPARHMLVPLNNVTLRPAASVTPQSAS